MTAKWFYPAQKEAAEELNKKFQHVLCNYQVITKDRVIENFTCFNEGDPERTTIETMFTKRGKSVSALIFNMRYVQGWEVGS